MALLIVSSSVALLESLADFICSDGFIVITTTAESIARIAMTMTNSINVKELGLEFIIKLLYHTTYSLKINLIFWK